MAVVEAGEVRRYYGSAFRYAQCPKVQDRLIQAIQPYHSPVF